MITSGGDFRGPKEKEGLRYRHVSRANPNKNFTSHGTNIEGVVRHRGGISLRKF